MEKLGFPQKWIYWVSSLVLQGSSQIIINGLLGKKITLKRGVRQGDPLAPFIFIIAMDFLPRWMQKLQNNGALRMPIRSMQPSLLYADDVLFFIKPEQQQGQILKLVLLAFANISGLKVKLGKSEISATAVDQTRITHMAGTLECSQGTFPMQYLLR